MLKVKKHGVLLEKTRKGFETEAVFNPAAIRDGNSVHLFYRAVRQGNYSTVGHCILDGSLKVVKRSNKPILFPEMSYESQGIEDPRITKIDDIFYITYSVYDQVNVSGAYATSCDLQTFQKQEIITPKFTYREYKHFIECCSDLSEKYLFHYKMFKEHGLGTELSKKLYVWDKNVLLFPRKINGKFAMLHRIHPGIQIVFFKDFNELTQNFWEDYMMNLENYIVMDPALPYESSHIGGGCPPIETEDGWLLIYHAAESTPEGLVYHASVALLDLTNPQKEKARLPYPLISPSRKWEKQGVVNNIIFPSGTSIFDDTLYIYYGAADTCIATASLSLSQLLNELKNQVQ